MKIGTWSLTLCLLMAMGGPAVAQGDEGRSAPTSKEAPKDESTQPLRDAFLKGRIVSELALNPHVSAFDLDVTVENGVAYLKGAVDSEVERDLAVEIARGVDGITDVRSTIETKPGMRKSQDASRSVERTLDDAAVNAKVKSKLLANRSTAGTAINVTTRNGVVTLTGQAQSEATKDLAERIAKNTEGVQSVRNELTVRKR